jgi:glycosyltransferase involved in cell wall biosynthesis
LGRLVWSALPLLLDPDPFAASVEAPLVLHVFPTFAIGGSQVRFAAIANRFGRAFRHAIISMDGNTACTERLSPGLDVSFPEVRARKKDTLGNVWRFRRLLRRLRPHVLVTYNWGALEWAIANAFPLTRHIHIEDGFGPEERSGQILRRVLMRRHFLRRSTVALPSRVLWRIATQIWRLDEQQVLYVPNGVDLGDAGALDVPPWGEARPVIGTVAALRPEKNLARLLRAFAMATRDGQGALVIVGDGAERPMLEALAGAVGIADRVHFTGHVDRPHPLYRNFDVFALSSDTEQMPLSVLEAMAARLPVVATDVGDIRHMVADTNQPFVTVLEEAALAHAMRTLLDDADLRRQLGRANRAKAEREFDQETMFQTYARLFEGPPIAAKAGVQGSQAVSATSR